MSSASKSRRNRSLAALAAIKSNRLAAEQMYQRGPPPRPGRVVEGPEPRLHAVVAKPGDRSHITCHDGKPSYHSLHGGQR
jgi:hypothetical protein